MVRIRLFAQLRERAGAEYIEAALPDGATVADALRELAAGPPLGELLARLPVRMAVNRELAEPDARCSRRRARAAAAGERRRGAARARHREPIEAARSPTSCAAPAPARSSPSRARRATSSSSTTRPTARWPRSRWRGSSPRRSSATASRRPPPSTASAASRSASPASSSRPPRPPRGGLRRRARDHRPDQGAGADLEARARDGEARWVARRRGALVSEPPLTHLDAAGEARMVDVGAKAVTERRARARARVRMSRATAAAVAAGDAPKGEVLGTARLAGILAAKQTPALIPLAHPISPSVIDVIARGRRRGGPRRARQRGRASATADRRRDGGDGRRARSRR